MTRMSVVLSWSTYPDLKSCQRNLVNWVASMKKGVTLKQTETNDFALVSSQTNFRVAVETSWKAGRISFWQQLVRLASPISPFHGFSLPEVPSTFAAACVRVSQKTGDCWLTRLLVGQFAQMISNVFSLLSTCAYQCFHLHVLMQSVPDLNMFQTQTIDLTYSSGCKYHTFIEIQKNP